MAAKYQPSAMDESEEPLPLERKKSVMFTLEDSTIFDDDEAIDITGSPIRRKMSVKLDADETFEDSGVINASPYNRKQSLAFFMRNNEMLQQEGDVTLDELAAYVEEDHEFSGLQQTPENSKRSSIVPPPEEETEWKRRLRLFYGSLLNTINPFRMTAYVRPLFAENQVSNVVSRFPFLIFLTLLLPVLFSILALTTSADFNKSAREFSFALHPVTAAVQALRAGEKEWNVVAQSGVYDGLEKSIPKYRFQLLLRAEDPSENLLVPTGFALLQQLEMLVYNTSNYALLCWTNNLKNAIPRALPHICVPLASITTYFYPGSMGVAESGQVEWEFTGQKNNLQQPVNLMMNTFFENPNARWFGNQTMDAINKASHVLRTQITLGFPVREGGVEMTLVEYNELVDTFIRDMFHRYDSIDPSSYQGYIVALGGDRVVEAMVGEVLFSQIHLILISIGIVFAFMLIHTWSISLTAFAGAHLLMDYLSGFYLFSQSTERSELSAITSVILLTTLTVNCNSVLVVYESYFRSGYLSNTARLTAATVRQRAATLYGQGVLPVCLNRVCALLVLIPISVSPIPAVRDFGAMTIIVLVVDIYMIVAVLPPAVLTYQYFFSARRNNLRKEKYDKPFVVPNRNEALASLLRSEEATKVKYSEPTLKQLKESDNTVEQNVDHFQALMDQRSVRSHGSEDGPSTLTYVSDRIVPLVAIFQLDRKFMEPEKARKSIVGALASYTRQIVKKSTSDEIEDPAVMTSVGPIGIPSDVNIAGYRTKWDFVARFLGTVRPDDFSSVVAHQLTSAIHSHNVDAIPIKPELFDDEVTVNVGYHQVLEERDSRFLNSYCSHIGMHPWFYFFRDQWLRLLFKMRFIVFVLGILLLIISLGLSVFSEIDTSPFVMFLKPNPLFEKYYTELEPYNSVGECDFCSAYQQPMRTFPQFSVLDMQQCAPQHGLQMHTYVDHCGVCFGDNSCVDCEARPFGVANIDNCGLCKQPNDFSHDYCFNCEDANNVNYTCWWCYQNNNLKNYAGPGCTNYCDDLTCSPSRGRCNKWTGECECHQSFNRGFFASDPAAIADPDLTNRRYCTVCSNGFSPPSSCNLECTSATSSASCACSNGRCTGCPGASMGSACSQKNVSLCKYGTVDAAGNCSCPLGFDAETCSASSRCSSHGLYYTTAEAPVERCHCFGQWKGAECQYCRCFNGGTCDSKGTCHCLGAWSGFDCSYCDPSCVAHGLCPPGWPANHYSEENCPAIFCTEYQMANLTHCPFCPNVTCSNHTDQSTCLTVDGCVWIDAPFNSSSLNLNGSGWWWVNVSHCEAIVPYIPPEGNITVDCKCKGAFFGIRCEECAGTPLNLSCDPFDGKIIGCDGRPTGVGYAPKYLDQCGICGGEGRCRGCSGIAGTDSEFDDCGICGWRGVCPRKNTSKIMFTWGLEGGLTDRNGSFSQMKHDLSFRIEEADFQWFMLDVCDVLFSRDDVIGSDSKCIWRDFVNWVKANGASEFQVFQNDTVTFPVVTTSTNPRLIHNLLYKYAESRSRLDEVGFTSPQELVQEVRYLVVELKVYAATDLIAQYKEYTTLQEGFMENHGNRGYIGVFSIDWVSVLQEKTINNTIGLVLGMGVVLYFLVVSIMTLSPGLTIVSFLVFSSMITGHLALLKIMNTNLGVVEQMSLSLTIVYGIEYFLHPTLGYAHVAPNVHNDASIPKKSIIRRHIVRTVFIRTGFPLFTSTICTIVASMSIALSSVAAFRSIGISVMISNGIILFYGLIIFPGMLLVVGPLEIRELKNLRLVVAVVLLASIILACIFIAAFQQFPFFKKGIYVV